MRIKDLLLEDESIESMFERIINSQYFEVNIGPLFNEVKDRVGNNEEELLDYYENIRDHIPILYHGGKLKPNEINHIIYRERPFDTQMVVHNTINNISNNELGVPVRAMLFSSTSRSLAGEYGTPSIVIPLDEEYRLYYSTLVDDMYTSNKVFNFREYMQEIPSVVEGMYETKEVDIITDRIHQHFSGMKKPDLSKYTYKHLNNYVDTIFLRTFSTGRVEELKDFDKLLTKDILVKGYREMFNVLSMAYGLDEISNIDGTDFESFETDLYSLTKKLFEALKNYKINWIVEQSKKYVASIKSTQDLDDIENNVEIMLPEGDYAVLDAANKEVEIEDEEMFKLMRYYILNKS